MRETDLIDQFADLVVGADDPRRLARQTLDVVLAVSRGRSAAILLPEKNRLSLFASIAVDQGALDAAEAIWRACRGELQRGEAFYAPQRAADKRLASLPGLGAVASVAVVPVLDDGSVAALLYVDSEAARFLDDGGLERLGKFSRIVAKAVGVAAADITSRLAAEPAPQAAAKRGSREELLGALRSHEWNIARAARVLGVTRRTIYLRLARFGIPRERIRKGDLRRLRPRPATA